MKKRTKWTVAGAIGLAVLIIGVTSAMKGRNTGAAVVIDPDQPGPGIITERDLLQSLGHGQDPDHERVGDHLSAHLTFASPEWSLERAAEAMVKGNFRHLVVVDGGDMVGILSMRDIVRCWVEDGATSELPSDRDASRA